MILKKKICNHGDKMRRFWIIILLVVSMIAISCSKSEDKSDKVNLLFWHSMGGPLGNSLNGLVKEFNESQDEIIVNEVSIGNYTALTQKLSASIQSGNQPDLAQLYENTTVDYIKSGVLVPVQNFIDKDPQLSEDIEKDFYPVFISSNTYQDKIWTFPFNKSVRVLYYNKDMFLKYGFDPNIPPKTWDDFIEFSRVISAERDDKGNPYIYITNINSSATQLVNLILQAGGEIFDYENNKALFNSKEGIEALRYLRGLVVDNNVAYLSKGYEGQNDFLASKVAMYEGSSVSMAFMANDNKLKFNIGIAPIPSFRTKKNVISGTNIAIFKSDSKKEEAAWKFVKWLTDKEQTAKWSYETYYMPLRRSALQVSPLKERLENNSNLFEVYDQLNEAATEPSVSEWRKTRTDIEKKVLEPIYNKDKNLSDAELKALLDDVAKDMEKMIKENKE